MADRAQGFRRTIVKLVSSTVVRGAHRGESHGGVYLLDLEQQDVRQVVDWAMPDIEWYGNGGERGLRGLAFDKDRVYVASGDALLAYSPDFELLGSWHNPYLKHCHQITVWERTLYITSAGFDSILGFHLDEYRFHWAMQIQSANHRFKAAAFDPSTDNGPLMMNKLHINSVYCSAHGVHITGLRTGGMLHFNGEDINMSVALPAGSRDARPFRDGVLFNDSESGVLRYTGRGEGAEDRAMTMPEYVADNPDNSEAIDDKIAEPGFARGLCVLSEGVVAGGSSPSTIALYDLPANTMAGSVRMSPNVRSAVHSIEVWPYG